MNSQVPILSRNAGQQTAETTVPLRVTLFGFFAGLVTGFVFSTVVLTIVILAVVATTHLGTAFADESIVTTEQLRPIGEMRRDVEAFMKNSKSEDDLDLQVGGIVDLCYIHQEIVADPRFASNRQLKSIRAVAAARLKKYLKTIEIEKARQARRIKKEQSETNRKLLAGESVPKPPTDVPEELAASPLGSSDRLSPAESQSATETSDADAIDESMYGTMSAMGFVTGGPSQMFNYLSGNYAPPWDHGEELVNLIENTINPDFWQNNGGSGIIFYYRPSRIIVVGATSQIHDDMTNMLRNLRRLSR